MAIQSNGNPLQMPVMMTAGEPVCFGRQSFDFNRDLHPLKNV